MPLHMKHTFVCCRTCSDGKKPLLEQLSCIPFLHDVVVTALLKLSTDS